jgi:hypothetical protein
LVLAGCGRSGSGNAGVSSVNPKAVECVSAVVSGLGNSYQGGSGPQELINLYGLQSPEYRIYSKYVPDFSIEAINHGIPTALQMYASKVGPACRAAYP